MPRKAFFAAFFIDESAYTPEPGPVDNHFVAADLAQSSFGEQSGISHIIVWNSVDHLLADHRSRGPITVDYLLDGEAGADQGAGLNPATADMATRSCAPRPSFRDQLSPTMRDTLAFEYYEVRPCIDRDHQVQSFRDEDAFNAEIATAQKESRGYRVFWSLYGVDRDAVTTLGDFVSKDAAHEAMNAILAMPAAVRNALQDLQSATDVNRERLAQTARVAADWLDDMINQSSNLQRI